MAKKSVKSALKILVGILLLVGVAFLIKHLTVREGFVTTTPPCEDTLDERFDFIDGCRGAVLVSPKWGGGMLKVKIDGVEKKDWSYEDLASASPPKERKDIYDRINKNCSSNYPTELYGKNSRGRRFYEDKLIKDVCKKTCGLCPGGWNYSTTKAPTTKAPTTKAPTTKAPTTKAPTPAPTTTISELKKKKDECYNQNEDWWYVEGKGQRAADPKATSDCCILHGVCTNLKSRKKAKKLCCTGNSTRRGGCGRKGGKRKLMCL